MGKLVVTEFISLDGVIDDPGGGEKGSGTSAFEHGGWAFEFNRGDEGNQIKNDELMAADAQLLGRITKTKLRLAESKPVGPDGVLVLTYERQA